jgi:hypothetical protein
VAYNGSGNPYALQTAMTVGEVYRVTGWARGDGSVNPMFWESSPAIWVGTSSTAWQYFDVTFVAGGADARLYAVTAVAGYVEFDDVQVYKVQPDRKGIVCKVAGVIWRPDPWAFGTRLLEVIKQDANTMRLYVVQDEISIASGNAYNWYLGPSEEINFNEQGVGAVFTAPAGTLTAGAAERLRLTRARNGDFVGYLNDTQIGSGNDLTVVASTYSVLDFDAGDILFVDEQYLGVIAP